MLRIFETSLELVAAVTPIVRRLKPRNRGLADQLERAAISVSLNIAEGSGAALGNRRLRYETALGSVFEVHAALRIALAAQYVDSIDPEVFDRANKIGATLNKILRGLRA